MRETYTDAGSYSIARYAGYALVLLFFALVANYTGFQITYGPLFQSIASGEFVMWMGVSMLLFPGCCLIGFGLGDMPRPYIVAIWSVVERMSPRNLGIALTCLYAASVTLFALGNRLVLLGFPITDDEYATKFGGQVLASGHVVVPMFEPSSVVPTLFLLVRNGSVTAMDWLGGQLAWAVAELTGTGTLVFSVFAALPLVCIPIVIGRRYGRGWALLAAAILVCSPMSFTLSLTSHAHVLSRGLLSVALLFFVLAQDTRSARMAFFCGLALASAFVCRPFECAFLAAPFVVATFGRVVRGDHEVRKMAAAFLAGAAIPVAIFATHAWLITGNPFRPARFAAERNVNRFAPGGPFKRLGANLAYNLLLLGIWFAGPLGIVLVAAGALRDGLTRMLSLSVVAILCLALFHDNIGIHSVGPIHYSEAIIPLSVIAVAGVVSLRDRAFKFGMRSAPIAVSVVLFLVVGLGSFTGIELIALRRQAEIQAQIYGMLDAAVPETEKAVVLADDFRSVWQSVELNRMTGSWVLEWRRPRPEFNDRILVLNYRPGVETQLRERFPDRRFLRLEVATDYAHPRLTDLP